MSTVSWPDHLLTLDEWAALPEETFRRTELVEGVVQVVPQPLLHHQRAMACLVGEFDRQLPQELTAVPNAEVVVFETFPPTVRVPDVSVLPTALYDTNPPRISAADVVLAVEIISPGTARTDRVTKLAEYADAGIGAYWIVDLADLSASRAFVLVDGEYEDVARGPARLTVLTPAALDVDLTALTRRR